MSLKIGMKAVDITPPAPVPLIGQFYLRIAREVESRLLANVFAAEGDGHQLIICSCDLLWASQELCDTVRKAVAQRCPEINTMQLIIGGTHIHTGPDFHPTVAPGTLGLKGLPDGYYVAPNPERTPDVWNTDQCHEWLTERVAQAICEAWESREDAKFGASFGRAVVGHCRRVSYDNGAGKMYGNTHTGTFTELEGGNDSGIELLYAFDAAGKPMGALVNVSCPAQVVEGKSYLSSDYWGKVRDYVKKELGEDFVVVGLCGAGGDQSPRDQIRLGQNEGWCKRRHDCDHMRDVPGAIEIGKRIGRVILDQLEDAASRMADNAVIRTETAVVDYPIRRVTETEYKENLQALRTHLEPLGRKELTWREAADVYPQAGIVERFETQDICQLIPCEVHVARFDDIAFATNTFELFLDYGNRIRARSRAAQTFLIQLCNGARGYLPTEKAEQGKGYSAQVASGYVGHVGGNLLVEKTLNMIDRLWKDE